MKTCRKGLHQYEQTLRTCPVCRKISVKAYAQNNPSKLYSIKSKYAKNNPGKIYASQVLYRHRNPEKVSARQLNWRENNLDKRNSYEAKRRAAKLQRTPKWLTSEHYLEIQKFYSLAKELEVTSKQKLEVDHIIPLQGEQVSGLHVPWNLQILTESENTAKGNRLKWSENG